MNQDNNSDSRGRRERRDNPRRNEQRRNNAQHNNRNRKFKKETKVRNFVYGCNPAFEVIRSGKRKIESALICKSSMKSPRIKKLIEVLERKEIPYETAERGRLIDICESHDHQGVVLYCSPLKIVDLETVLSYSRVILLNNVEDTHNVGAVLRSAEIFGFTGVLLPQKGSPEIYPSVVKVSAGATEFLEICNGHSVTRYLAQAKDEGFTIVSLDGKGKSNFSEVKKKGFEKILLVLGGEDKGVGQFVLNSSDYVCAIEQYGKINSLNASVAAGIAMASI